MTGPYLDFGDDAPAVPVVAADSMTVCRATDEGVYCKWWDGGAEEPRKTKRVMWNDYRSIPVSSIYDVGRAVDSIRSDYRACIVRGKLINPRDNTHVRRAHRNKPTLEHEPHRWMMLDVDHIDFAVDPTNPEAAVRHLQTLVPALREVTTYYHCSGSWGIKPGPRLHLFYWLTAPATDDECKAFAGSLPVKFDLVIYTPSQPHYTADPLFSASTGAVDPCGETPRGGVVHGALDELYIGDGDVNREMGYYCDQIRKIEHGDPRHPIINKAAYTLAGWVQPGYITEDQLYAELVSACADNEAFSQARLADAEDEIRRALADGKERPRVVEQWRALYIRNSEGKPRALISNYITLLRHHPDMRGRIGYDARHQRAIALAAMPWDSPGEVYPRELNDIDVTRAVNWISMLTDGGIPTNQIREVNKSMDFVAQENKFDDVRHWIDTLPPWDGTPRLSQLFPRGCSAEDNPYHRAVSRVFVLSMIARGLRPGCKVDTMVILCGKQGTYKSTFLNIMGSGPGRQYFSADIGDIRDVFSYLPTVKGKWLIEIPELAQFGGKHVESIKSFLTKEVHVGREPYQARATTYPVGYVMAGSTNNHTFLTDITGNRRFLTVKIPGHIDTEWVSVNRDQIFAEARTAYHAGEKWYLDSDMVSVAAQVQEMYTAADPWIVKIGSYLEQPPRTPESVDYDALAPTKIEKVTIEDVLIEALDMHPGRIDTKASVRCGECLSVLGWTKARRRINGKRCYLYERPKEGE